MYNRYPSDFTTYEAVNNQLKGLPSGADLTADKTKIIDYIRDASRMISGWSQRTFVPYISTSERVHYALSPDWIQELPDDTLVVNSILDTVGDTLSASSYQLRDIYNGLNGRPYRYFELAHSASFSTQDDNDFDPMWTIDGIFGYSTQPYANAWLATTTINNGGAVASGATSFVVTSASNIQTRDYIRVESEFMQVTDISTNTLTVKRGVNGSTAVAHDDALAVDVWQVDDGIHLACTRLTAWLYSSRQNEHQSIQFQDGTVANIRYPQIVAENVRRRKRPLVLSGRR